jgi:nucleotide-binding universal stress UspA family protein
MFAKILVAIDGTESGQVIFEQALALALTNQSKLMLLHVLEPESFDTSLIGNTHLELAPSVFQLHMQQLKERDLAGIQMLRSLEEKADSVGISAEFTQSLGAPGKIICGLAKTWEADLIVMGRRGLSGLSEMFLGSVSNHVLHHAHCNVLTLYSTAPIQPRRELVTAATAAHSS